LGSGQKCYESVTNREVFPKRGARGGQRGSSFDLVFGSKTFLVQLYTLKLFIFKWSCFVPTFPP